MAESPVPDTPRRQTGPIRIGRPRIGSDQPFRRVCPRQTSSLGPPKPSQKGRLALGSGKNQTLLCRISEITPFLKALNDNKLSDGLGVTRGGQKEYPVGAGRFRHRSLLPPVIGMETTRTEPVRQVVFALIEGIVIVTGAGPGALIVEEEKGSVVSPDGLVLKPHFEACRCGTS
jgi:hypothetical protein